MKDQSIHFRGNKIDWDNNTSLSFIKNNGYINLFSNWLIDEYGTVLECTFVFITY
jgi:hypothetical protein